MSWLKEIFAFFPPWSEKSKRTKESSKKSDLKAKCPTCGYEADEQEFLDEDPGDTICPVCGEDETLYEL